MNPIFSRDVSITSDRNKNVYGLALETTKIEKEFNNIGIPSRRKGELYIPDWIKENKKYLLRFLRGFMDTDGSISCQRNYSIKNNKYHTQIRIYLACTSKNMMKEISKLLNKLNYRLLFRRGKRNLPFRDIYRVTLSGEIQTNKWFEEIRSRNPKHFTKYFVWKKFGFCPPYTTLDERVKILKEGVPPYDYYKRRFQSGQMSMDEVHVA